MRLQLVILGWEVFSLSLTKDTLEEEVAVEGIGGGSSHNFERLPETYYEGEYEERGFGFH